MGLFNLFGKETKTTYQTTNTFSDDSTNAGDGSVALGQGAALTINNENLSDDVALGALAANRDLGVASVVSQRDTAAAALAANRDLGVASVVSQRDTAAAALAANRDVNLASLDTTSRLANSAINTIAGVNDVASRERVDVLETTNLALQNQAGVTDKLAALASGALERSQTPDSAVSKQLIWGLAAVAVVLGFFLIKSPKK